MNEEYRVLNHVGGHSFERTEDVCELTPANLKAQIREAWKTALGEAGRFVLGYKLQGKNGQKVFDQVFRNHFVGLDVRLKDFPEEKPGAEKLLDDIEQLIAYIQRYRWPGNFCLTCGEPTDKKDDIYCRKCRPAAVRKAERDLHDYYSLPSASVVKVKKGSAARRGKGRPVNKDVRPRDRKKGKGGKAAK